MASTAYNGRRWLGALFLFAAAAMLITGETVLRNRLSPAAFLVFWAMCFVFTFLAIVVAFRDVSIVRRRIREEQRELVEDTLKQLAQRGKLKAGTKPPEPPTGNMQ
jgi:hypothetical protein